jgi:hypothetical protein
MDLGHQREPVVLETVDDPDFPGRLVDVQRELQQIPADAFEDAIIGRLRESDLPNVIADVEARIVDPNRMVKEGNLDEALAIAGNAVEAPLVVEKDLLEIEPAVLGP